MVADNIFPRPGIADQVAGMEMIMFKPKAHPVPGGTIYTFWFKEPVFVPETKSLNETEAKQLQERLDNAKETVRLLQNAVAAMVPLNRGLKNLKFEVNALAPMDGQMDYRVEQLLEVLSRTGYYQTRTEDGYFRREIKLPGAVAEILEELGDE